MAHQDVNVVFVPGAWHSPDGYDAVITHLHKAGYKTSKVYTPSVLRNGEPAVKDFSPDIAEIRKQVSTAVNAGQKAVLVMHSYGGLPGSEAIEGLDQTTLAAQGHKDGRGVIQLVYLASFMLRKGESLGSVQEGGLPDWMEIRDNGTTTWPLNPAKVFYNDFESPEEVGRWISELRPFSAGPAASVAENEPWRKIPTTYVACGRDNAIPVQWQNRFVRNAIEAGAVDMRLITWDCGHTPFGVRPLEVSRVIRGVVGDVDRHPVVTTNVKSPVTHSVTEVVGTTEQV